MPLTRRATLAATLALPALQARAEPPLTILAHRVHQTVATPPNGPPDNNNDATAAFTKASGIPVQWLTFDNAPLAERLLREASLPETDIDVGFLLNTQLVPRIATLFEPLAPLMANAPIEDLPDIFPNLLTGMQQAGAQIALPIRHASSGLHYNAAILEERGIAPPTTIEDLIAAARATTTRRDDGTRTTGLVMPGVTYPNVIDLARAWNGEFITPDLKCAAEQPPMLNAIRTLRTLFEAGAFPRNFATLTSEDTAAWMQQGRGVFALQSMGRNRIFNDPKAGPPNGQSYAGRIRTIAIPASATLQPRLDVAPAKVEFWGMAIPRNARRKALAYEFIRAMLSPEATRIMALNGNGPVRNATYQDPAFRAAIPYADEERRVLQVARIPMPAFDEAARAADLFKEEAEAAVLGLKTPEAAMASLNRRVTPLLH